MQSTLETLYPAFDRSRLVEAVHLRSSCRAFAGALDAADRAALSYALGRYALPGVRIVLTPVAEDFFTATLLGMKRITGCRDAAVVIIDSAPLSRIHAGIVGESLVLEATARGLGSCWVSGSFRRKDVRVPVDPGEAVLCVIALGQIAGPLTPPSSRHRKAAEHLCRGNLHDWPPELSRAVSLVQAAPSAMNMQPWVMSLDPQGTFILDASDRAQLDAGIALCHAELALETPHTWHFGTQKHQPMAWAVAR
ncbi:MAG: nitroreductase family protein [Clostridiales bacterium]|nr:nitroreductase family protein [Clostridiales bacterium]